jgi:hypothetical protein
VPANATTRSTEPGALTASWNACIAPIEKPTTAARCSTLSSSTSSRRISSTVSRMVVTGNRGPSNGGGVLLGEDETPLPSSSVAITKNSAGSSARPSPMRKSLSAEPAMKWDGTSTAPRWASGEPKVR